MGGPWDDQKPFGGSAGGKVFVGHPNRNKTVVASVNEQHGNGAFLQRFRAGDGFHVDVQLPAAAAGGTSVPEQLGIMEIVSGYMIPNGSGGSVPTVADDAMDIGGKRATPSQKHRGSTHGNAVEVTGNAGAPHWTMTQSAQRRQSWCSSAPKLR